MKLVNLFPSLFEVGVASLNFSDVMVKRSPINDKCVIIYARKPVEWFMNYCSYLDMPPSCIDDFHLRFNTDNSVSVIER